MPSRAPIATIIVIEPDVLIRTSISDYLRECGYKVIEGAVAADVWAVLKSNTPIDIVFAEVNLSSGASGFELAREIRQTHPGLDVILTTGIADAADKSGNLCEESPIKKPYDHRELATRIHLLIEKRRSSNKT